MARTKGTYAEEVAGLKALLAEEQDRHTKEVARINMEILLAKNPALRAAVKVQ